MSSSAPTSLWWVDFKGDFAVGRTRCCPLTVADAFSRYLIACIALRSTSGNPVRRAFEQIFDAFGLPGAIRSDKLPDLPWRDFDYDGEVENRIDHRGYLHWNAASSSPRRWHISHGDRV